MIDFERAGRWVGRLVGCVAVVVAAGRVDAQGVIVGRVVNATDATPVAGALVQVIGTSLRSYADSQGAYVIRGVSPGERRVRAIAIGFVRQEKSTTARDGGATTLDFELSRAMFDDFGMVTVVPTTSDPRVPGAVASVDVAALSREGRVRNLNDVLTARAPGVEVVSGVQSGAGMRVRVRGTNSLSLSNEPIYVIDGIRMTSADGVLAFTPETGGARPSRTGDLGPDEIQQVEILKGPSASTLYGGDAANGVVVITTKRGRQGALRWTAFGEAGRVTDRATYPTSYTADGHAFNDPTVRLSGRGCTLPNVASTAPTRCVIDSVRTYSVFADPQATPLGTGDRYDAGLQLAGGTAAGLTFFASASHQSEINPLTLPQFERARIAAMGSSMPDFVSDPNVLGRNSARVNVDAPVGSAFDVSLSAGFIDLENRLAAESNRVDGIGDNALSGPGFMANGSSTVGYPLHGYRAYTPGQTFAEFRGQTVRRYITSGSVTWRPLAWLESRASFGEDRARDADLEYSTLPSATPPGSSFRDDSRATFRTRSTDLTSTATFNVGAAVESRTTAGVQLLDLRRDLRRVTSFANPQGSPPSTSLTEENFEARETSLVLDQVLTFGERVVATGGVRSERRSFYGAGSKRVLNPRVGLSWTVPGEKSLLGVPGLDMLRLRGAFGFATVPVQYSTDASLFLGNVDPERVSELEGGVDARFLEDRASLRFTAYRKRTRDVIATVVLPPASTPGFAAGNVGAIRNSGVEVSLDAQLVRRRDIGVDVAIGASTNENVLLDLDAPPVIGIGTRAQPGSPLLGYWGRPLRGYQDRNGDGTITYNANPALSEVTVGDTAVFLGSSQPTSILTIEPGVDLLGKVVRISALFDHRAGQHLRNDTEIFRCIRAVCSGRVSPGASLFEQARAVARLDDPAATDAGYVESATFTRWRELAVTVSVPDRLTNRFLRARNASVTFAGRNLHTWTGYTGVDPEANSFASDAAAADVPRELFSLAPPTYYTARINIVF